MIYKILVHRLEFEYVTDFEDMKLLRISSLFCGVILWLDSILFGFC